MKDSLSREKMLSSTRELLREAGKLDLHDDLLLLRIADTCLLSRSAKKHFKIWSAEETIKKGDHYHHHHHFEHHHHHQHQDH